MRIFKKHIIRLLIFLLLCVFINQILVFALMPTGGFTRLMLHELYTDDNDIEIVFSGSSLAFPHFNPAIIDKDMDTYSFNIGSSAQTYPGNYAMLQEMFTHHNPKYVILTTEWINYIQTEESVVTYLSLIPYIKSPVTRFEYLLNSGKDGSWRNRIFWWTGYHVNSYSDMIGNIRTKTQDSDYLNYKYLSYESEEYRGRGYVYRKITEQEPAYNPDTYGKINWSHWDLANVNPNAVKMFEKIVSLCHKNNCELILINPPRPKIDLLSVDNYFEADAYINELALKNEVKYYNFNLAKPELFSVPDNYFYDHSHMNGLGATVFSHSFSKFMNDFIAGKDVNSYFYSPQEFLASIDYLTNVWFSYKINNDTVSVQADSLQGSNAIPEYQFIMTDENDNTVLYREYSLNGVMEFTRPESGSYILRVNGRTKGTDTAYEHFYEEKIEFGGKN